MNIIRCMRAVGGVQRDDWGCGLHSCDLREPHVWCSVNSLGLQTQM